MTELNAAERNHIQFILFPEKEAVIANVGASDPQQAFVTAEKIKRDLREKGVTASSVQTSEGTFVSAPGTDQAIIKDAGFKVDQLSITDRVYTRYHDAFERMITRDQGAATRT